MLIGLLTILEATLTLPGIAGIILTVGMAVDANVLIFERIREELKTEKSAIHAFDSGYARAKITVLDANITTLIAAVILFAFGSGPVKGFAITLGIGIITTLFTAYFLARHITSLVVLNTRNKEIKI
jgi:protein-export membrane protein SecD